MSRTKSTARAAAPGRRAKSDAGRGAESAGADNKARKDNEQDGNQADWEEGGDEIDLIPDIDGLLGRPAANRSNESEARRRIEMLREDRALQQALSDVFDL